jgi:SAM-dependent methyltransferase
LAIPPWYPNELATAGPEHLDDTYVAGYDRKAGPEWTEDFALLRALGLDGDQTLVDLGAGTGALATSVAPLCKRVVAVDVSPAMLMVLSDRADHLGLCNLECVQQGILSYEHQGEPADFVYTRNALHHLPDFWKVVALRRIAAMLRPGGILRLRDLIFSFEPAETDRAIEAWLAGAAERATEGWTRAELEVHLREEYSTFSWLLVPMIERAGFEIRDVHHDDSRVRSAYTCVRMR